MTALRKALAGSGFDGNDVEFQIAMAKYLNRGGTTARIRALCDAADQRERGGRNEYAAPGRMGNAPLPSPMMARQASGFVPTRLTLACPSRHHPQRSAARASPPLAEKAAIVMPSPPLRSLPGHARRGGFAIAAVQPTIAKSLFDRRLPDGRRIRDVKWGECPALAQRWIGAGRILLAIYRSAEPLDPLAPLDTIVSEADLQRIVNEQETRNVD
jgi:hypothetical protein